MTQTLAISARFRPFGGWSFAWLAPALLLFAASSFAAVPDHLQDHFSDLANKVDDAEDAAIENKLTEASTAAETQLVLVVINKFSDYPGMPANAKDFAYALAKDWKVGSKSGKGIVVLFSIGDRQFHVVKTKNIPVSITERIASSMRGEVTLALKDGKIGEAMSTAADIMAKETPKSAASLPHAAPTPVSTPTQRPQQQVQYDTNTRQTSSTGIGMIGLIIGGIILFVIIIAVISAFSNRGYSSGYGGYGYGGYGPAPYYGGYGDGGGGFWSGMFVGGMMNNMFGGHGGSHYGGGTTSSGSSYGGDSGGNSSWGSFGGGDSGGGGWDSGSTWSSGGGDSSSFGGGDFGGGSSGGEW